MKEASTKLLSDVSKLPEIKTTILLLEKCYVFLRPQGKVMFLHRSVCSQGGFHPSGQKPHLDRDPPLRTETPPGQRPPLWTETSSQRETPQLLTSSHDHCSGQYASYWNAFLLSLSLIYYSVLAMDKEYLCGPVHGPKPLSKTWLLPIVLSVVLAATSLVMAICFVIGKNTSHTSFSFFNNNKFS